MIRLNMENLKEAFGNYAEEVYNATYECCSLEDIYEEFDGPINFEAVASIDQDVMPHVGDRNNVLRSKNETDNFRIVSVAERFYNPIYVPEDSIFDSDFNWEHVLVFYIETKQQQKTGGKKMANKFYAVRKGNKTGVFQTWAECEAQVKGYKGADYKSFPTKWQAETYLEGGNLEDFQPKPYSLVKPDNSLKEHEIEIYTDGSFIKGKGYAWAFAIYDGCGLVSDGYGVGTNKEAEAMRNVAGEMSAAMRAIAKAKSLGYVDVAICHDYLGLREWISGAWKTKNEFTKYYAEYVKTNMADMDIDFIHVKGHTGVEGNEYVDELCRRAFEEAGL